MMSDRRVAFSLCPIVAASAVFLASAALADDAPAPVELDFGAAPSVTTHEVTIDGRRIRYTATAGYMPLPDYGGETKANVFYMAYVMEGDHGPEDRPLTFSFNGGPGSSSVWLHLGTLGPRRVVIDPDDGTPPPPYRMVDNEYSWLDLTDMVFIDPVSTGYSRAVEGESPRRFHGLDQDAEAVADFIRLYVTRNERWSSPKFLIGESYGTTRAAAVAGVLQDTHGMFLSGISLVSAVLNFQTLRFHVGNDTPYPLFLPSYTATAWHHGRLDDDLQEDLQRTLRRAEHWAMTEYLVALARGDSLPPLERERIVAELARYTGLSEEFVDRANLRITVPMFTKELLRDEGRTVGRLDSRFKGIDRIGVDASPDYDPSLSAITGPYTAALNDYVRRELGYKNDLHYEILTGRVRPWDYSRYSNQYVNVAETLRRAMSRNPHLRVFLASGYYDLATPYLAADYTMQTMGLDASLRDNLMTRYYEAGHMMYIRDEDLAKLKRDAAEFYAGALENRP